MPDYGWAYVNLDALNSVNGATGSITFRSSATDVSGTSAFIYATASHKVGLGINTPGATDGVVGALPSFILDVSASAGDTTAVRMVGDLQVSGSAHVSGTLTVDSLHANTVISSSHLIIRDPVIGMGFGITGSQTSSVGDRGLILGLAGNNNQAFIWDQTSGSFVIGKVGAQGPDASAFDIPDANLSTLRASDLTASNSVSASVFYGNGEHLTGIAGSPVTSYTNAANNRIITSVDSSTINGEASLTFDGSTLKVVGATSGSGAFHSVGAATFGGTIAATGSATLQALSAQATTVTSLSASSILEVVGATVLGSTLHVSGVIKAPSIGTGVDDSVVVLDSDGTLRTDEIDSRVWGSTLVDGNGASGQLTLWNDSNTVQGSSALTYDGSTLKVDDAISGSGAIHAVGAATFGNTLAVTGSSTLASVFATTLSASSTLEAVGSAYIGGDVAVTGAVAAGQLLTANKVEHSGDGDTYISFTTDNIEFVAGNEALLTLAEATQDIVTVGDGGDVDFQVKTNNHNHTIFAEGSTDLVGIRSSAPTAVLHLSESGVSPVGMPKPMFRIDHPGDASGKEFTEALFFVTGTIPDDYFEARVGINTKTPEGAFHVKTREGQNTFVVTEDKVVIGNNSAASKFHVRQSQGSSGDRDVMRVESILNSDDTVHNLFYVTGSTDGTGVFGSENTGSVLKVSGSSFMTSMHVQYSGTNQDTNVGPRDYIFGVDTSAGSPKIFLESAATAGKGRKIVVKDTGNNAGSNNIKITGSTAGDLIEYAAETLVNSNKGAKTLVSDGASKWFVIGDG